jgi:predicted dehydrogenase
VPMNRRQFIKATALTGVASGLAACHLTAKNHRNASGANKRLQVAFIGAGGIAMGQGMATLPPFGVVCPCFAEVDSGRWGAAKKRLVGAQGYQDYREMFDKQANDIDAVVVSTPDHHHYPATILAMMAGKHVYTQKPLAHTVWEARQLLKATSRYKVATSMGNQYHAGEGVRQMVEWVRSGELGEVKKAHVWTDRCGTWWKQGMPRPKGALPVPSNLDWDVWLGPAPERPYHKGYHPFAWRGFRDFGTGALGDMGCHTLDGVFWALGLNYFDSVELLNAQPVGIAANAWPAAKKDYKDPKDPGGSAVRFQFPARKVEGKALPALELNWYEGGRKPAQPKGVTLPLGISGVLLECDKGWIVSLDDYCIRFVVVKKGADMKTPTSKEKHCTVYGEFNAPARTIKRSEGHWEEWYAACVGDKPYDYPAANFKYASPFTETILAATIAQVAGGKLLYDAENMAFKNNPVATSLLTKAYRQGWDFRMPGS